MTVVFTALLTLTASVVFLAVAYLIRLAQHSGDISVDPHEGTTAHVEAIYPFHASGGPGRSGVLMGVSCYGGAPWLYDPWELYSAGELTNPNMLVAGQIGRGKSSLVKSYLWRQQALGRFSYVIDPKGEFGPLADASGGTVIRLAPGGGVTLNPLGTSDSRQAMNGLTGIVSAALARPLTQVEQAGLFAARRQAADQAAPDYPTLSGVVEALHRPDAESVRVLNSVDSAGLAATTREVAAALLNMCTGHLAGMLDGQTTTGIDLDAPMVVVDVSALFGDSEALAVVMAATLAWLHPVIARSEAGQRILVLDEAWALLHNPTLARWLRAMLKLSRNYGLQNVMVVHRMSDLEAAGGSGSEVHQIAKGLLADTETRVVYSQAVDQLQATQAMLGLSDTETSMLPILRRGVALWRVGSHSGLVEHLMTDVELKITDTDASQRPDYRDEVAR